MEGAGKTALINWECVNMELKSFSVCSLIYMLSEGPLTLRQRGCLFLNDIDPEVITTTFGGTCH